MRQFDRAHRDYQRECYELLERVYRSTRSGAVRMCFSKAFYAALPVICRVQMQMLGEAWLRLVVLKLKYLKKLIHEFNKIKTNLDIINESQRILSIIKN